MSTPMPPPTPTSPGSVFKPSDILYILGSGIGLVGAPVAGYYIDHPLLGLLIGPATTFAFWLATYAKNKGD